MDDSRSQFLESASNCFNEDLEKIHASQGLLASHLSDDESRIERANRQFALSDQRPRWLITVICSALVIVGLITVLIPAYNLYRASGIIGGSSILGIPVPSREYDPWSFYFNDLTPEDKLLLFGDTSFPDEVGRREAFWRTEPDNPGAYLEFLAAYRMENGQFPDDMLDVAKDLDPENAIYLLFHAGELTEDCTKKVSPSRSRSSSRGRRGKRGRRASPTPVAATPPVTRKHVAITDPATHRKVIDFLHQAVAMAKCSSYADEMMKRRLPLLDKKDHDWVSRTLPIAYLALQSSHSMPLMKLTKAIQAEAYRCEQEKDAEGLKQIIDDWKLYCGKLHESSETLIDALVLKACIHAPCQDFAEAAKVCDLPDTEKYFSALDKQLTDEKDARRDKARQSEWNDVLYKEGGILSGMSLPILDKQVNDSSSIRRPDTRPDRLADHAFWNRVFSAVSWKMLLVFSLIAWLWGYRRNVLVRKLSRRLVDVFTWRDWMFVFAAGTILPVTLYWLINGTGTPLSVQNCNLSYTAMLMPSGQSGSLVILLLIAPMLAVSHRLNCVLPFTDRCTSRMLWGAAILALLAMPVFGIVGSWDRHGEELIIIGFGMQGLALLLLLADPVVGFIRKHRSGGLVFAEATRSHILVVCYLVASVVMALQTPVYHVLEKHWVAKDEIFKLSPEHTSFTYFESQITIQALKEMGIMIELINAEQ